MPTPPDQTDQSRPALAQATAELTALLGDPDPAVRWGQARDTLATWIDSGAYDDLLAGLGDGMCAGLVVGLTDPTSDQVLRRATSASVLGECIWRDNQHAVVGAPTMLRWGDQLLGWLLSEPDLRTHLPGKGPTDAIAIGAGVLAALAGSRHLGASEHRMLLDVISERATLDDSTPLAASTVDALAAAILAVLSRATISVVAVDTWLADLVTRIGAGESVAAINLAGLLRATLVRVSLAGGGLPGRADLLLQLVEAVRATTPGTG